MAEGILLDPPKETAEIDISKLSREERIAFFELVGDRARMTIEVNLMLPDQITDAILTGRRKLIERGWFERYLDERGEEKFRGVPGIKFVVTNRIMQTTTVPWRH